MEEKTKQQPQLLSENEEDFLPFSTTYIVDTATERKPVGSANEQKPFDTYWYIDKLHQRFYFQINNTPSPPVKAATENATNYPIQHYKHPQPLQC